MPKPVVFIAYPYSFTGYRECVRGAAADLVDTLYADDVLTNRHILDKITTQMQSAQLCLFDLTGDNANVSLELGVAIGLDLNYRVLLNSRAQSDVFADMKGWDQLRYHDLDELEHKLSALFRYDATFVRRRVVVDDKTFAVQPYMHIDIHPGRGGPDGHFLDGFVINAGQGVATEPILRLPGLGVYRLGGIMKPGERVSAGDRYDNKEPFLKRIPDPMARIEYGDLLGNVYAQEGPVTQRLTPGGSILTYEINALSLPFIIESRTLHT